MTFHWRIISRSNVNGKVHTFQKDFDDYESYQQRSVQLRHHPRALLPRGAVGHRPVLPHRHLPEGVDLEKYEKRRTEKKQSEAEKIRKRHTLERTQAYLKDYLEEDPDDSDAKSDLEKVEKELSELK